MKESFWRKLVLISSCLFLLVLTFTNADVNASNIRVKSIVVEANENVMIVDGIKKKIDQDRSVVPLIRQDAFYVPVRIIVNQFGVQSSYKAGIYSIVNDKTKTTFDLNKNKAYINGKLVSTSVNAFYVKNRLYLPVYLIGKALNQPIVREGNKVTIGKPRGHKPLSTVKVPVLMYHHFDPHLQTGTVAHPAVFYEQMKLLKEHGYTTITIDELIAANKGQQQLPAKPIMITMDDGYESNYMYVFPVLKELQMKATIFIITDFIENPQKHPSPYSKMNWEQIREMSASGFVSFQSHTDNHHYTRGDKQPIHWSVKGPMKGNGVYETYAQYEERLLKDLVKSKQILQEKLGKPVQAFAYPKGEYSADSEKIVKKAGFEASVSTDYGLYEANKSSLYLMKRVNIHGGASASSILQTIEKVQRH